MSTPDLDLLLDDAVDNGILEAGGAMNAISGQARKGTGTSSPKWTAEEEAFLAENYGRLSEAEIGRQLAGINGGFVRSEQAVHERRERDMELPAPSKHPDYMTAYQVGKLLGCDERKPCYWIDMGIMPGEYVVVSDGSPRTIRRIHKRDLIAWLVNPNNWVYFDIFKMKKGTRARRMVHMRRMRQGWCWLTTRQVARMHQTDVKMVTAAIHRGRAPLSRCVENYGTRNPNGGWAPWFVRSDEAADLVFPSGAESHRCLSNAGEAFLVLCRSVGMFGSALGPLLKPSKCEGGSLRERANWLPKNPDRIGELLQLPGMDVVEYDPVRNMAFADWRQVAHRFPSIKRAAAAFLAGHPSRKQTVIVRALLWHWSCWYADRYSALAALDRKLSNLLGRQSSQSLFNNTRRHYETFLANGLDPLR
jgi:hypothetical protein